VVEYPCGWPTQTFFEAFVHANIFDSEVHYDIALRFIYFKKVREDIEKMVELHNIHQIRRQKSRCEYMQFGPLHRQSQKLEELRKPGLNTTWRSWNRVLQLIKTTFRGTASLSC
jgi:hypothetical protein